MEFPDLLTQIICWRNQELKDTDYTQLPDAPVDKEAWATYRQELRDLPETNSGIDPAEWTIPVRP